ncbi:MAG: phosphate ABC transporter permease PstA [Rhodospirillales bacterium]|nr:phosphate ABC transporter permease PstA [Rhodospirillales bacterium]
MNKSPSTLRASDRVRAGLARRYRAERRFRRYGQAAILFAVASLFVLLSSIGLNGLSAFTQAHLRLDLAFDPAALDEPDADFGAMVRQALYREFPEVAGRSERRKLAGLVSENAAGLVRQGLLANPQWRGRSVPVWLPTSDRVDLAVKGSIDRRTPESERQMSNLELDWVDALIARGRIESRFNTTFFTSGDSRQPESAGILGAFMGSVLTLAVTFLFAFPLGVAAAVYLEEFAPRNLWTHLIEVNINNLAAVPSIVFGLLGLAVFLGLFGLPRSAPLVGGLVLGLMTLPTIVIAARSALAGVPPSIREAAQGVGASPIQVVFHHVLPLALPGMLTGAIIGMARALGETAPLLMIGMVAFIVDVPTGLADPATVLPVQVYLWADNPERAFVEKTAAAILVLLVVLGLMNGLAVVLRRKFERKW